ncbi:non-homologous end-joining DNA ligase [Pseudalkalibacillus caeni]|uniref:non-homologous end-joining DNA ligase n=1 Tax=Exobacillus caeni TaxID=2574798 RepID=UPI0026C9E55A
MGSSSNERADVKINGKTLAITSQSKLLWPDKALTKADYLTYLMKTSNRMLPFLRNRTLTVIRYPHGMLGESFYQKNCPDYSPDFIETHRSEGIDYIVCSNQETLLWLGNQLAFEFHIPFQTTSSKGPSEIVIDLDPPSRNNFNLAVHAAQILKEIFDRLKLISYVKTSGNKGLQLYLPLPENEFSYEDTRRFTKFLADFLVNKEPTWFTTERMKKNRGNKLYVDYLQHAEGKTIVAPYSVRGNKEALVATPLSWKEVKEDLCPEMFPLEVIEERLEKEGCPFDDFFKMKIKQPFEPVLNWLMEKGI